MTDKTNLLKIQVVLGANAQPCGCGFNPHRCCSTHQPSCLNALLEAVHGEGTVSKPAAPLCEEAA